MQGISTVYSMTNISHKTYHAWTMLKRKFGTLDDLTHDMEFRQPTSVNAKSSRFLTLDDQATTFPQAVSGRKPNGLAGNMIFNERVEDADNSVERQ